jgi:hypothetical protein
MKGVSAKQVTEKEALKINISLPRIVWILYLTVLCHFICLSYHLIYGYLQQIILSAVSPDILNPTGNISGPSYLLYYSWHLTDLCLRGGKEASW